MQKLEIICENCESHFILAAEDSLLKDETSIHCPICSAVIPLTSEDEEE